MEKKKKKKIYFIWIYSYYNAGNSYSHELCAKYDINIMGMITKTSQNDQKEKSLRDLTKVKYHCPLLEPILVNDRSFTSPHGGQFSFRRNCKNGQDINSVQFKLHRC